jgi:hypothetical protein
MKQIIFEELILVWTVKKLPLFMEPECTFTALQESGEHIREFKKMTLLVDKCVISIHDRTSINQVFVCLPTGQ